MGQFYCDCKDGWYQPLDEICGNITSAYSKHQLQPDIRAIEIREKYGSLHFDYMHGPNSHADDLRKEIEQIVDCGDNKSEEICEECGKLGVLRDYDGWLSTRCDKCFDKMTSLKSIKKKHPLKGKRHTVKAITEKT